MVRHQKFGCPVPLLPLATCKKNFSKIHWYPSKIAFTRSYKKKIENLLVYSISQG